jgi:dTDP-glucose 4,6-dehydratase
MEKLRSFSNILVTGGAGFIGSNFIRYLFTNAGFSDRVVNLDALTYAGNPQNLADIAAQYKDRYIFVHGDIRDAALVQKLFADYAIDAVVHFAAESHVDRSILDPQSFITTNVMGTYTLLEAARQAWKGRYGDDPATLSGATGQGAGTSVLFHHISTDEVYGSLGEKGAFKETTPYDPRSPYSASKASSDFLVKAYGHTYGLPVTISNCSNNYGPYQFPEKLIPLMILNMLEGKPLPVYGDGRNIRDWLYVADHNAAVWTIMTRGHIGETYNIGGENEWENIRLLHRLIEIVAEETGKPVRQLEALITYVKDRPGHDRRYAIDCSKLKNELGWKQSVSFDEGLRHTVRWYLDNPEWIASVRSGAYREWIEKNYEYRT